MRENITKGQNSMRASKMMFVITAEGATYTDLVVKQHNDSRVRA